MLAARPALTADPDRVLDVLDGLILAGGRDVDPVTYGAEPHPATDEPRTERDEFELALARRAMERDIPLLGICRGMQVMNVARGGTLVQDLPEHVGHEDHRRSVGTFDGNDHPVRLADGSLAARAAGRGRARHALASPPGRRPRRRRVRGHRLVGRRRAARGARGSRAAVRARRPVASGGRRGVAGDRRARRRGAKAERDGARRRGHRRRRRGHARSRWRSRAAGPTPCCSRPRDELGARGERHQLRDPAHRLRLDAGRARDAADPALGRAARAR